MNFTFDTTEGNYRQYFIELIKEVYANLMEYPTVNETALKFFRFNAVAEYLNTSIQADDDDRDVWYGRIKEFFHKMQNFGICPIWGEIDFISAYDWVCNGVTFLKSKFEYNIEFVHKDLMGCKNAYNSLHELFPEIINKFTSEEKENYPF